LVAEAMVCALTPELAAALRSPDRQEEKSARAEPVPHNTTAATVSR
jgi:hypothetical protein